MKILHHSEVGKIAPAIATLARKDKRMSHTQELCEKKIVRALAGGTTSSRY